MISAAVCRGTRYRCGHQTKYVHSRVQTVGLLRARCKTIIIPGTWYCCIEVLLYARVYSNYSKYTYGYIRVYGTHIIRTYVTCLPFTALCLVYRTGILYLLVYILLVDGFSIDILYQVSGTAVFDTPCQYIYDGRVTHHALLTYVMWPHPASVLMLAGSTIPHPANMFMMPPCHTLPTCLCCQGSPCTTLLTCL